MVTNKLNEDINEIKLTLKEQIKNLNLNSVIQSSLFINIDNHKISKDNLIKASLILYILELVIVNRDEVLRGGQVMSKDGGELYDILKEAKLINPRQSSHHKNNKLDKDASMQAGEIFKEFLIGKTKDGKTWFQLEAHSLKGLKNLICHIIDYMICKITGKNVGQYGLSAHEDHNPLEIIPETKSELTDRLKELKDTIDNFIKNVKDESNKKSPEINKEKSKNNRIVNFLKKT